MPFTVPKWVSDVAIVGLIFAIGAAATRMEMNINDLRSDIDEIKNKRITSLEKKIIAVETAISIHHGPDWSDKVQKNTLMRVEDLEETIGGLSQTFEQRFSVFDTDFNSTVAGINNLQARIEAVDLWTRQADKIIEDSRLEQFRVLAVYSDAEVDNPNEVFINKQHVRAWNFKNGDTVILSNPFPPGKQIEVSVKGFLDDPSRSDVLVQINKALLPDLGLTTIGGQYELYTQSKPETLRWKSLNKIYKELMDKRTHSIKGTVHIRP